MVSASVSANANVSVSHSVRASVSLEGIACGDGRGCGDRTRVPPLDDKLISSQPQLPLCQPSVFVGSPDK